MLIVFLFCQLIEALRVKKKNAARIYCDKACFYFEAAAAYFPVCMWLFLGDLTDLPQCGFACYASLRVCAAEAHCTSGLRKNRVFHFIFKKRDFYYDSSSSSSQ